MDRKAFSQDGLKRYFRNTSWLMGGQFIKLTVGTLVTIAMARYLGPGLFGTLNYVLAITLLLGVIANLGLDKRTKKELVEHPENKERIIGTHMLLTLLPSVFVFLVMGAIVYAVYGTSRISLVYICLGGSFLISPFKIFEIWFHAKAVTRYAVKANIVAIVLSACFKIWLILSGAGLPVFAFAIFLESLVAYAGHAFLYHRNFGSLKGLHADFHLARTLLRDSWPLLLSGIAVTIYMQLDQVMLGALLDSESVGQYAAAVRVSTVGYFVPMLLGTALFPAIVSARNESRSLYYLRLRQFFELNAFCGYLIAVPLILASSWIIHLLYGEAYSQSGQILAIHACCSIFVFLGVARGQALIADGHYHFILLSTVTGALLNIVLNFLLIPAYGGIGAAISTLVAQFVSSIALTFLFRPVRKLGVLLLLSVAFPFGFLKDLNTARR